MKSRTIVLICLCLFGIICSIILISSTIDVIINRTYVVDDIFLPLTFIVWGFIPLVIYEIWTAEDEKESPTTRKQEVLQIIIGFGFIFLIFMIIYVQFLFNILGFMEFLSYTLGYIIPVTIVYFFSILSSHVKN